MDDWRLWVGAAILALGAALKPILNAASKLAVRWINSKATPLYEAQGKKNPSHSHADKVQAVKDELGSTGMTRVVPRSLLNTITPGEKPKG